jgi:sulfur carrier protein
VGGLVGGPPRDRSDALGALTGATVRVIANGKPYEVAADTTVASFIRARDLDPRYVVAEWNGQPLERARYEQIRLSEGDRLELVRPVAGG